MTGIKGRKPPPTGASSAWYAPDDVDIGSVLYVDANRLIRGLTPGASGTVLKSNGLTPSIPSYETDDTGGGGGGGALVKIATFTVSGTPASLNCYTRNEGSFSGDLFQGDYRRYISFLHDIRHASVTTLLARVTTDGSTAVSSAGAYAYGRWILFNSAAAANSTSATFMNLGTSDTLEDDTSMATNGTLTWYNPTDAARSKGYVGEVNGRDDGGEYRSATVFGTYKSATAVKGFQLLAGTGNLVNGGVVEVYAV